MDTSNRFTNLDNAMKLGWSNFIEKSPFAKLILSGDYDSRLIGIYLTETYHYTFHNARNQALVGVRVPAGNTQYMKFCFEHALEETGHELMALHDLRSMGFDVEEGTMPRPLPETQVLIGYLYWISAFGCPVQRLGYSYWAEDVYIYIDSLLKAVQRNGNLSDSQMTFFRSHAHVDEKHAAEVRHILGLTAKSDEDWAAVQEVLETSLRLTQQMADGVAREYERLRRGESSRYSVLSWVGKRDIQAEAIGA